MINRQELKKELPVYKKFFKERGIEKDDMQARFTFIELSISYDDKLASVNCIYSDELIRSFAVQILENVTEFLDNKYKTPDKLDSDFDLFCEAHCYSEKIIESYDEFKKDDKFIQDLCINIFLVTFRLWYEHWGLEDLYAWMEDPDCETKPCMTDRSYTVAWALNHDIKCFDYLTIDQEPDTEMPAEKEINFYKIMAEIKEVLGEAMGKLSTSANYDTFWKEHEKSCFTVFMINYIHMHGARWENTDLNNLLEDDSAIHDLYMRIVDTEDDESLKKEMMDENNVKGFTAILILSIMMKIILQNKGLDFIKDTTKADYLQAAIKRINDLK